MNNKLIVCSFCGTRLYSPYLCSRCRCHYCWWMVMVLLLFLFFISDCKYPPYLCRRSCCCYCWWWCCCCFSSSFPIASTRRTSVVVVVVVNSLLLVVVLLFLFFISDCKYSFYLLFHYYSLVPSYHELFLFIIKINHYKMWIVVKIFCSFTRFIYVMIKFRCI